MGRVDHRRPWEWVYSLDDGGHWGCSRAQPVSFTQCPSGPPRERAEGHSDGKPSSSRQLTRPQRLPSSPLQGLSASHEKAFSFPCSPGVLSVQKD